MMRSRRVQVAFEQAEVATRVKHINGENVAANVAKNAQADVLDKIDEKFENLVCRKQETDQSRYH